MLLMIVGTIIKNSLFSLVSLRKSYFALYIICIILCVLVIWNVKRYSVSLIGAYQFSNSTNSKDKQFKFHRDLKCNNYSKKREEQGKLKKGQPSEEKEKVLVVYAYYEEDWRAENLEFFIDHAVFPNDLLHTYEIEYVFVINGWNISIQFPECDNIHVIYRENTGFDLCSWKTGIDYFFSKAQNQNNFHYLILMNESVRGPFLPNFIKFSEWPKPFIELFKDNVKLVGTTCACGKEGYFPLHIQSMFLVLDRVSYQLIRDRLVCGLQTKVDVINHFELSIARMVIDAGYNIACMSIWWRDWDFRNRAKTRERCKKWVTTHPYGDNYYPGKGEGGDLYPLELIFFKTSRNVRDEDLSHITKLYYKQLAYNYNVIKIKQQ